MKAIRQFLALAVCALVSPAWAASGAGLGTYGGSVTTTAITSTVLNDGNNPNSPALVVLSNYRLLACYSWGTAANFENSNEIRCKLSDLAWTAGVAPTWGNEQTILSPGTNRTLFIGELHTLSNGTIVASMMDQPNDGSGISLNTTTVSVFSVSVNGNTVTASALTQVATGSPLGGAGVFSQTGPVELAGGASNLMMTVYGGASCFGTSAYFSTTGWNGTWGNLTTLVARDGTCTNQYDETDCHAIPTGMLALTAGQIYCFVRQDKPETDGGYDQINTTVTTGLSGWTAPVRITPWSTVSASLNVGRPCTVLHPTAGIVLIGRWTGPETAYGVMYPPYTTSTTPQRYGAAATQNWYNGCVLLPNHNIGAVIAQQVSSGPVTTKITYQEFQLTAPP